MFSFICKFDILMKFIQNINDVRNEVWFNINEGIIYISFPRFHTRHLNKLSNSCNKRSTYCSNSISFIKSTVNNMSSYTQTVVANAVAFGLDHRIPTTKILTLNLSSIFNTLIAMWMIFQIIKLVIWKQS